MARIALDQNVRAVAAQLGVSLRSDPTALIVDRCVQRVATWTAELGPVTSLEELLEVVSHKLRLRFEVVTCDRDLNEIKKRYLAAKEVTFADLDTEINSTTDAVVVRLRNAPTWSNVRYVAVIDGRGKKRSRVWFSKWHEVAHLLAEPQTKFIFRRTQAFRREPVERLMDQIAGALAFYEPLFLPHARALGLLDRVPRIAEVTSFAASEHSYASLQATFSAVIRHNSRPLILVEAMPAQKVSQEPSGARLLRAVTTTHNPAALQRRIFLHRNMRVPKRSVIFRVYSGSTELENEPVTECLSWWESSGEHLPVRTVVVEAMSAGVDRVLALCSF